ncbi:MAG TPA: TetR-like C-terminal domain-containing protein [Nocardioides sp.]
MSSRAEKREQTFAEIVRTSRTLLAEGEDPSLRAVAARMGLTAPALYRYVANHQELVDLVAFEIDRDATDGFRAAADRHAADDPAARLVAAIAAFRRWALDHPREFALVFANPVAESSCIRRELVTVASSGHFLTGLVHDVWVRQDFPLPPPESLDPAVLEAVTDPLLPADVDHIAQVDRGLVWIYMRSWASLYGVVTLEVFGHLDPRVRDSGALFVDVMAFWIDEFGLGDDRERLVALMQAELRGP